jgi:hypothetical protein
MVSGVGSTAAGANDGPVLVHEADCQHASDRNWGRVPLRAALLLVDTQLPGRPPHTQPDPAVALHVARLNTDMSASSPFAR